MAIDEDGHPLSFEQEPSATVPLKGISSPSHTALMPLSVQGQKVISVEVTKLAIAEQGV
jgi:hypothetical protein